MRQTAFSGKARHGPEYGSSDLAPLSMAPDQFWLVHEIRPPMATT